MPPWTHWRCEARLVWFCANNAIPFAWCYLRYRFDNSSGSRYLHKPIIFPYSSSWAVAGEMEMHSCATIRIAKENKKAPMNLVLIFLLPSLVHFVSLRSYFERFRRRRDTIWNCFIGFWVFFAEANLVLMESLPLSPPYGYLHRNLISFMKLSSLIL